MAIPLSYNVRNLRLRKSLTVMTALGIALTVATAVFIMALLAGLGRAFATTGDPLNVLMLRKGSDSELAAGGVSRDAMQVLKDLPGVAKNSKGEPLVSGEDILVVVMPRKGGTGDTNVTTRFLTPLGIEMRPQIHLTAGRWFTPGQREVVVSSSINRRFEHANIGDTVHIGKGDWPIVGVFDASGTAHDSEIWGDINQLVTDFERTVYSSVLVRATDPASAQALKNRANDDQRLELNGLLEPDYYASQTKSGAPIKIVGWIVAFIMAVGSCFAAANTMYAAVAYRGREIATLRVIGFSRPEHFDFVHAGVAAVVLAGCDARHSSDVAVQRHDDRNAKSGDVQRSCVQPANDADCGRQCDRVCPHHGSCGRVCAGLARFAKGHT